MEAFFFNLPVDRFDGMTTILYSWMRLNVNIDCRCVNVIFVSITVQCQAQFISEYMC